MLKADKGILWDACATTSGLALLSLPGVCQSTGQFSHQAMPEIVDNRCHKGNEVYGIENSSTASIWIKITLDAIWVANAKLNMSLGIESGSTINWLTFNICPICPAHGVEFFVLIASVLL